ncbi:RCC1/BLIP-II [Laetiporus sulphureus 93-53]|uniref:RCC1/BLIP-II n=1 Tax=Laetiporus sulphureus 93-53 TaxID=1314785 RepID=A0A165CV99_9APHY|nr:RCC1/BLIP-II [Laetiporus sulphureus 93-53]KZT03491.1 RCC1/BLIP-II [Laetiporus sulphureus 93-53]
MLQGARGLVKSAGARSTHAVRGVHVRASSSRTSTRGIIVTTAAAVAAGTVWYSTHTTVHNDAPPETDRLAALEKAAAPSEKSPNVLSRGDTLNTLIWGSNKAHVLEIDGAAPESIRTPAAASWLENVALRGLAIHERHAACVDARGDVYQWGDGFSSKPGSSAGKPTLTLKGKNITRVQVTPTRVFALSASGRIYVLSSSASEQSLAPGTPTPASSPWWGTGWYWGEEEDVDFVELLPNEKLGWKEKFVSIAAGSDHLLALTSAGRTFAHPISLNANAYGQLGFRKFDVPAPASTFRHPHLPHGHTRVSIELTPKSIADPYAKASQAIRRSGEAETEEEKKARSGVDAPLGLDDKSTHFSDKLFEVPALRGVDVDGIAAGSRTSFVKTKSGRVLGWGANEYGQIGLGGQVTLEAITVPTEVILWRHTPAATRTTCLDVYAGGDLTFFKVERRDGTAMPYIDVLSCGNGQWGGLGNAQYSNAQGTPVRTRNVSGLLEYSEPHDNLQPIVPYDISVSPTGHVLLTLDTLAHGGPGAVGRDLMAWGANYDYQLGSGRRGSIAAPAVVPGGDEERLMLAKRRAAEVRDLRGRVWKKGVDVEQRAVAGWGNSVVYWKICS